VRLHVCGRAVVSVVFATVRFPPACPLTAAPAVYTSFILSSQAASMNSRSVSWRLLGGCLLLALTACATINEATPYPAGWQAAEGQGTPAGCPELAGEFRNSALDVVGEDAGEVPHSLTDMLERMDLRPRGAASDAPAEPPPAPPSVTIAQSDASLTFAYRGADGAPRERRFRYTRQPLLEIRLNDLFTCGESQGRRELRFLVEVDRVADGAPFLGAGQARTLVTLYRGADGSLVARWNRQSALLIFLVPYVRNDSVWLRFPRAAVE